jgi:DNA-directed RNA polymerase specialized sigma24 family protein
VNADTQPRKLPLGPDAFSTTRWTVVLTAGGPDALQAKAALEDLCGTYWYPLYVYIRRQVPTREDAEDLTQSFFSRLLERNYLTGLNSEKGKFRAFLLASLKHFLANEWDRAACQKRGGGETFLSLDWHDADTRYQITPADHLSPDKLYDRAWAVTLLERVVTRLRDEHARDGKAALFEQLKPFLMAGKGDIPYAQVAASAGLNEGALRVAVHRLRRRYRELLQEEIAQTLSDPSHAAEEMRALLNAFREP